MLQAYRCINNFVSNTFEERVNKRTRMRYHADGDTELIIGKSFLFPFFVLCNIFLFTLNCFRTDTSLRAGYADTELVMVHYFFIYLLLFVLQPTG